MWPLLCMLIMLVVGSHATRRISPRVMIISMFDAERDIWLQKLPFVQNISIVGASPLFPTVHCCKGGLICQFTTGEAEINAAVSTMSLFLSPKFDLRKTYFLIAGIAGGNPYVVTSGSATFAAYSIQPDQQYQLDAREIPAGWSTGYWAYGTNQPGIYPTEIYGTEVFKVNTNLLKKVLNIVKNVTLVDSPEAKAFRKRYASLHSRGSQAPTIVQCDVATSDVYFAGTRLSESFGNFTKLMTNGTGTYCTTAQEDSATLESALRAHVSGLLDYGRFIILRTVSDFDRGPPGSDQYAEFELDPGAFGISIENLFVAGYPIVKEISNNWYAWVNGVKHQKGFYGDILGTIATYEN